MLRQCCTLLCSRVCVCVLSDNLLLGLYWSLHQMRQPIIQYASSMYKDVASSMMMTAFLVTDGSYTDQRLGSK